MKRVDVRAGTSRATFPAMSQAHAVADLKIAAVACCAMEIKHGSEHPDTILALNRLKWAALQLYHWDVGLRPLDGNGDPVPLGEGEDPQGLEHHEIMTRILTRSGVIVT